jgi:putative sugar O-methyltransferase
MLEKKKPSDFFIKKIKKNFNLSFRNYDNYSASKYWKQSIKRKKKLFDIKNLKNFRNNGLSKNIDEDYINKKQSEKYFKQLILEYGFNKIKRFLNKKNIGNLKHINSYKGYLYSVSDLFLIKYLLDIEKKINFSDINIICEIGQGFGLLSSKFFILKKFKYIMVDLPESNFITAYYLKKRFPKEKIIQDIDLKDNKITAEDLKKGNIFIISPWIKIHNIKPNLFINTRSMMEMNSKSIKEYFKLINNNISRNGYFLCINRYYKDLVGYPIELHLYPFGLSWNIIISKVCWKQSHIHFLLLKKSSTINLKFKNELKKIKIKYIQLLSKDSFFLRRHLPIIIYRYYKIIKHYILEFLLLF